MYLYFYISDMNFYSFWCFNSSIRREVYAWQGCCVACYASLLRPCWQAWEPLLCCSWYYTGTDCMYAKETLWIFCFSTVARRLCWSHLWCFAINCWKIFPGSVVLVHYPTQCRVGPTTQTYTLLQLIQVLAYPYTSITVLLARAQCFLLIARWWQPAMGFGPGAKSVTQACMCSKTH